MTRLSPEKQRLLALLLQKKNINVSPRQTISRRDNSKPLPLSFNQEGLWFIDRLNPGKGNYNIPGNVCLKGRLNVAALEKSLSEIVRRHESLRTAFAMKDDGTIFQMIAPSRTLKLQVINLKELPGAERKAEALRLITEEIRKPFDLSRGPLFRALLLRIDEEEHVLVLSIHHIVCDGWSMGVFKRELTALYGAFSTGKPSLLPELPIQCRDWALWQREYMQGKVLETHLSYWKRQLGGGLSELQLPIDRPRPPIQSYRGMHQPFVLSSSLTMALKTMSQQEKVTLFMTMLAAFKALLYYYKEQNDIVVGSTFAHRDRSELEGLIGFFVNTLPLRTNLSGNPGFRELLRRVREVNLGAHAHHELPLAKLVKELGLQRDASRNPIYQVTFDLLTPDHTPAVYGYGLASPVKETLELPGLTLTPYEVESGMAVFDITFLLWDMPEGLTGTIEYCIDLFEPETIVRMEEHFKALLQHIVAEPDVRLNILAERLKEADGQKQISKEKKLKNTIHQKLKKIKRRPILLQK